MCFLIRIIFLLASFSLFSTASFASGEKVYRATLDTPESVKNANGFWSNGMANINDRPVNISLFNHAGGQSTGHANVDSGYVATTSDLVMAQQWAHENYGGNGYIYHIRPTSNFIDVNAVLGVYSPHPRENEFAAMGRIYWGQIIGWQRVTSNIQGEYEANPDYNPTLTSWLPPARDTWQLAGFPDHHPAWARAPWNAFSECELRSSCLPKKSAQRYGEEFYEENVVCKDAFMLSLINY
ncbi:TPA: enterotoxin A family protein [Morganella morganii]